MITNRKHFIIQHGVRSKNIDSTGRLKQEGKKADSLYISLRKLEKLDIIKIKSHKGRLTSNIRKMATIKKSQ